MFITFSHGSLIKGKIIFMSVFDVNRYGLVYSFIHCYVNVIIFCAKYDFFSRNITNAKFF